MREEQSEATRYDEFLVGSTVVSAISDVQNERAWIQSTHSVAVEP